MAARAGSKGSAAGRTTQDRPYCYAYPRPAVTVDLVVFTLIDDDLRIALIRRKHDPFAGRWALPGGFLDIDEPIEAAARRELREETGLDLPGPVPFLAVFSDPGRDPRGRTISLVHVTAVRGPVGPIAGADDAAEAAWRNPYRETGLAFDHDAIVATALGWLKARLAEGPVGLDLLPRQFDDSDVRTLFRAVSGSARGAVAWRQRVQRAGLIVPQGKARTTFRSV